MSGKPRTRAVRAGLNTDPTHAAVVPPISMSTTYAFAGFDQPGAYDYSRAANPTRTELGRAIADLEGGSDAVITGSGMGAITTVLLGMLPPAGRLLAPIDCYGGSWRLFQALADTGRLTLDLVDFTDPDAWAPAVARADLVWLETPSNPLLHIFDITAITGVAHQGRAKVVVDNTFATPCLQRPLELGADVVVHSATKYLNGHSDVVAGAVVSADPTLAEQLAWWANTLGMTSGALDSYLVLRGLRTLQLRMDAAQRNAAAIAEMLVHHPAVRAAHYPGLATHPQHDLAVAQMEGFGAIVSFELADEDAVRALLPSLVHFTLAESLGGVESLIVHPATMTHVAMPAGLQAAAGITGGLLRLSVGIEDPEDLVADLRSALDTIG